jgi:formylglycine-generating enzyme required for sulfatase activity
MVWVPPGEARLGSPPTEEDRDPDIENLHAVAIERGFWLDSMEVTKHAYRRFILAKPQWQKARIDASLHDGNYLRDWNGNEFPSAEGDRPVVNVSWPAAAAYAAWAGKRLPTEAEWEYAARAGTATAYWWGSSFDASRTSASPTGTQAVGAGATRNQWGLADMLGNAWEWTSTVFKPYPYVANDGREDPASVDARSVRGGSAVNGARFLRAAKRHKLPPKTTNEMVGFRCAR